jgi:iron complex transport system substrate-binding protein
VNCGFTVVIDQPPQRVVTIKSSTTEAMLALGLGDHLVGVAFLDGPIPPGLAASAAGTTASHPFSDGVPGFEATLALTPDLILAGWESNLTASGAGERDRLASAGVATWVPQTACESPAYRPTPLTWEAIWADIATLGAIFDADDAARALIADQQAELADVEPDTRGLTALWYSSGSDVPFVGAGQGAPQLIMETIGLTNIAADIPDRWAPMGWESVLAVDPDVIVLVDAEWNTADRKREFLANHPLTSELTAVREGRFLVVPFAATEPGVRTVEAAATLEEQLAELSGLD